MIKSYTPKIIVVDDEERMCRSLDALLTKAGYNVSTFVDAKLALKEYQNDNFDLLITDIKMPGMDGLTLLKEVRDINPEAMVILMTAYASLDSALQAMNAGAYDYLMKPIEFTHLELAVKRALEKRELQLSQQRLMSELKGKNVQLNRNLAELNALHEAGLSLAESSDLEQLLTRIVELSLEVIKGQIGSIMLIDEEKNVLRVAAGIRHNKKISIGAELKLGDSIAGHVAKDGEAVLIEDISSDPKFSKYKRGGYGSNSAICVPLIIKDKTLGVINISDPIEGEKFKAVDLRLLVTFAAQAAIAIDDAFHIDQAEKKLNEFSALYKISSELSNIDNSRDMTALIFNSLAEIMDIEFTVWLSWSNRYEKLVFNFWDGFGENQAAELIDTEIELKDKTVYSAPIRTSVIKEKIEEVGAFRGMIGTLTAVPIITKGALHGVFCLGSQKLNAFSDNDEYIASIVASQATSIYERQRAILNATRLMAMGKMISEISHDLKRPLTNIKGSLQIMAQRWPQITENDDFFETAEQELSRLNELVLELVDFSNPKKYLMEQKKISDIILRVFRLVENDLKKKNIEFIKEFDEDLSNVLINENEIVEVLLNLILNGIDAMPKGGTLTIKAKKEIDKNSYKPFVKLMISDSGIGIPPEIQNKVYDRYFTTKDTGTGLGLAICERIIMAHNGKLDFKSVQNEGTTFIILLPSI